MLPGQQGWTVPVAKSGPAMPRVAVLSLPSQLPQGCDTMCPAAGLEHVEAAQPTPSQDRSHAQATNITLPQVQELCLEEPREEPKQHPSNATARLATDGSTGRCFWARTMGPQSSH